MIRLCRSGSDNSIRYEMKKKKKTDRKKDRNYLHISYQSHIPPPLPSRPPAVFFLNIQNHFLIFQAAE